VVAAFGLDDLAVVRVHILLNLARTTRGLLSCYRGRGTTTGLRIRDVDDVTQAVAVLSQQVTQFGLKMNLRLQLGAAFECFELCELSRELLLKLTESCQTGHKVPSKRMELSPRPLPYTAKDNPTWIFGKNQAPPDFLITCGN
jgi:hypothetical protein